MLKWIKTTVSKRVLRWWLRSHSTFVSSCKISVKQSGCHRTYRASVVQSSDNLFDAEKSAEAVVQDWIARNREAFDGEPEVKWRKGHLVNSTTLEFEKETVLRLLDELRSQECRERFFIEEIVD